MAKRSRGRPRYPDVLTPAEWQVVDAARHGMSNAMISERRGVSRDAVKFHLANAIGKLGLSNRAELRKWNGIRRESPLFERENAMPGAVELGPIGQISRNVSDIGKAVAWYRDALGLSHLFTAGELAFFDCHGTRLYLHQGKIQPESVIYFSVSDIRVVHQALEERAVAFESAPHMIHRHDDGTEEWMAFFRDPDDGLLALMSQIAPG